MKAWLVFAGCVVLGLTFGLDQPWTDDARFYVPAAESYTRWVVDLVRLEPAAWSADGIQRAFAQNAEHPPVGKYVMGLGWLLFGGLLDPITACRIPVVLLWAWTCALVFRLVAARTSDAAGLFCAIACASLPRLLFDGHAETLDLPVTAFIVATSAAYLRYRDTGAPNAAWLAIAGMGLALGTKLNAPFALLALVGLWLIESPPRREGALVRLTPLPWPLVGMLLFAPLIVFALWPWLWFDTAERVARYLQFHLQHYPIYLYYAGRLYEHDLAPWTAPFVLTAMTTPLPLLALSVGGLTDTLSKVRTAEPRTRLGLLAALMVLAQLVAVALPGVPVYGGVKLFLPAFPFLCVLAGLGFDAVLRELPKAAVWRWAVGGALLLPGVLGAIAYHGAWLSYYAEWTGGVRGAAARGFERQYYDLAYPELAAILRHEFPQGAKVAIFPNPKEYAPYVREWQRRGELPSALRLVSPEQADVLVLTHESRWRNYPELMARYRTRPLVAQHSIAGVPLFSVFDLRQR